MGLLTDILKEIPQAAVLKEKIASIEAKYAEADTENAILKDDLRKANAEINQLKKQIEELTREDELDEEELRILSLMARDQLVTHRQLIDELKIPHQRLHYYLRRLMDNEYIICESSSFSRETRFALDQRGRRHLIKIGVL